MQIRAARMAAAVAFAGWNRVSEGSFRACRGPRPASGRGSVQSQRLSVCPPFDTLSIPLERRDVRVAEGARLESVCRGNSTVGSNPTLSAMNLQVFLNQLFAD